MNLKDIPITKIEDDVYIKSPRGSKFSLTAKMGEMVALTCVDDKEGFYVGMPFFIKSDLEVKKSGKGYKLINNL